MAIIIDVKDNRQKEVKNNEISRTYWNFV